MATMPDHKYSQPYGWTEIAEKANGRFAMLGIIAALGAYATTGQILPGLF